MSIVIMNWRLTIRWSRRACRRDEAANSWEATLRVVEDAGHGPPRGSAPPLGGIAVEYLLRANPDQAPLEVKT
jgi:hypothetical protein